MKRDDMMKALDPFRTRVAGMVRRMGIALNSKSLWQLVGYVIDGKTEVTNAEPFTGIGFYSRPPADGDAEAIAVHVGDAKSPAIVGTRDEATRKAVAGGVKIDETMVFNSKAMVYVKDDGTIEARSALGVALPLATKADLDAIVLWLAAHVHTSTPPGDPTSPPTVLPVPPPTGTLKLKGE